jgi:hypothetical protein
VEPEEYGGWERWMMEVGGTSNFSNLTKRKESM